MSAPCWSLPHLLSSSPQHEAQPGQYDLLQDDTVHRTPLPKTTRSTSSAKEPLSHVNYESGGNPRNTSHTVEEWNSVEVPSRRGSSQWMNGRVHNRSAVREVDDSNTGEVGERELVLVFSVLRLKMKHDAWMSECFWHTTRLEL